MLLHNKVLENIKISFIKKLIHKLKIIIQA